MDISYMSVCVDSSFLPPASFTTNHINIFHSARTPIFPQSTII